MNYTFPAIESGLFGKPVRKSLMVAMGMLLGSPSYSSDIVHISAELRDVIELETVEVGSSLIPQTLSLVGRVEPDPPKHFFVSGRVAGRVTALSVVEGQSVNADEVLVEIETLLPGNPPPKLSLRAPFAGVVTKVLVTKGQGVEAGQTLIELADLDEVFVRAEVFESLLGEIPPSAKARIRVEAYPEISFAGTLERYGGEVNTANGSLPAWFRVANPKHLLKPGMLADCRVVTTEVNASMAIPASALLGNTASPFVYVARDREGTRYRRATVKTGLKGLNRVEILSGLKLGNRVVTVNAHLLGLSAGGDAPTNSHGHDHGGHDGHGHAHGAKEAELIQWNLYLLSWLAGALGLSILLNLFLLRACRGKRKKTEGPS